ncbi:uncharacterized protein LOC9654271 isoform X1 [Selaginella moellendorffii]|uniref:uncharacterized protein LOC9654271 isoform X1 n=1 Tax=Selaginella moellendorffii TaxID=88036 RepID=UPI000D1C8204|nr:uncharacterized protein LOC9654271 isoform X1 [Selaginella moellendorffii]|eukprot:XP_024524427.1 uncharacterized protein LOC9654271 isoform X1 [Selaginella moellendorffii]
MVNSPFPRQPKSMGFVQGNLFFDREALGEVVVLPVGDGFLVCWNPDKGGFLSVEHRSEPGRSLWSTAPGFSFVTAALGVETVEEFRGSFGIHDEIKLICKHQSVDKILSLAGSSAQSQLADDHVSLSNQKDGDGTPLSVSGGSSVVITGTLFSAETALNSPRPFFRRKDCSNSVAVCYTLCFTEKRPHHLGFTIKLDKPFWIAPPKQAENYYHELQADLKSDFDVLERIWSEGSIFRRRSYGSLRVRPVEQTSIDEVPDFNRVQLTYISHRNERFFGFGEQFSCLDLKGRRVPILVQEQGVGRGDQPITAAANILSYRSGGSWHTTYAPSPYYMTSDMRCLFLENYEYSVFDLRRHDRVQIQVHSGTMEGRVLHGQTPAELLMRYTESIGRMRELPDWIHQGAVIGMQGGTNAVNKIHAELKKHDVPIAAFWLQDWVGQRKTSIGWQLWWNWEADTDHYQGWGELVQELKSQGIRTMTYCNPLLACVSLFSEFPLRCQCLTLNVKVESKEAKRRNMLQEALAEGFLVRKPGGGVYMIKNTSFDAAVIDLTNPKARSWLKEILRDMISTGVSGWMADFGEALPFDSVIHSDENPALLHNRFPELWAQLNREVVEEWEQEHKLQNGDIDKLVFFVRAGFMRSPKWSTLFWEGDQMVSWQRNDGIKSAVVGLLSSGISGYSLNHSDIGGYTTVNVPFLKYVRSEELLMRWMELNAFSVIFRTHEGNDPGANSQFYTNARTFQHFARCARIFKAWNFYRKELVKEAASRGMPVVRHLFLHYPQDEFVQRITYEQFLVGSELLVVPVLNRGKRKVRAYFPAGDVWVHVWTNRNYGSAEQSSSAWIDAPFGLPAVFVKAGSTVGSTFMSNLASLDGVPAS